MDTKSSKRGFARRADMPSLQLLVAVCEVGTTGKVAEREFISSCAVTKRVSDVEATRGTPLLHRHAHGVDLTPADENPFHRARSVLFSVVTIQGELCKNVNNVRGHVKVHGGIRLSRSFHRKMSARSSERILTSRLTWKST